MDATQLAQFMAMPQFAAFQQLLKMTMAQGISKPAALTFNEAHFSGDSMALGQDCFSSDGLFGGK